MNDNLFKVILAMDTYNRGYSSGVNLGVNPDTTTVMLGNAEILLTTTALGAGRDRSAGFYATAYKLSDNSVVISYRGTDQFSDGSGIGGDIINSYLVGGGSADLPQSRLAIEFYKAVATVLNPGNPDPYASNISVTGHSSGGGLAGLVGAIYHKTGVVFDNMAFKAAASSLSNWKNGGSNPLHPLENLYSKDFYQLINGSDGPVLNNDFGQTFDTRWTDPSGIFRANFGGLSAFTIEGEILAQGFIPGGNSFQNGVPTTGLSLHADISWFNLIGDNGIDPFDAHSVSTQVIRMFAGTTTAEETAFGNAWYSSAPYFWKVMYDDAFSQSIGVGVADGGRYIAENGPHGYDKTMRTYIAYSAIDNGANNISARPYGDTGIRAFYDDAKNLGTVVALTGSAFDERYGEAFSKVLVEYAAKLAMNKILQTDTYATQQHALDGALKLTGSIITSDFSAAKWLFGASGAPQIKSREALVDKLDIEAVDKSSIQAKLLQVEEVSVASSSGAASFTMTSATGKSAVFVGADGAETITGGLGNDYLYGKGGNDTLYGGAGKDVLDGGSGTNTLYGGLGKDTYHFTGTTRLVDDGSDTDILEYASGNFASGSSYGGYGTGLGESTGFALGINVHSVGANLLQLDVISYQMTATRYLDVDGFNRYVYRTDSATAVSSVTADVREVEYLTVGGYTYRLSDFYNAGSFSIRPSYNQGGQNTIDFNSFDFSSRLAGYAKPVTPAEVLGPAGGATPETDANGTITGLVIDSGAGGSYIQGSIGTQTWHPLLIQSSSTGGGVTTVNYESAVQRVNLKEGITASDVTFTTSGPVGNATLVVHINNLNYAFDINNFEVGKTISGTGVYDNDLHESIQSATSAVTTSSGFGLFTGTYNGIVDLDTTATSNTYYTEKIVFSDGTFIDLSRPITLTGTSGADTLTGFDTRDDYIDGGAGNDKIYGLGGNDTLYGGLGTDSLAGGIGNDLYILDDADVVIENSGEGTDTVRSSVTYTLAANVENLVLTGTTAINGTGNSSDNSITGNSAANTLSGGAGNDTYFASTGDVIVETANNGNDTVSADINWTLATNVENLVLTGTALTGTGNTLVNILTGNDGNNTLDGGSGADTLIGGTGDDLYIVDNAGDIIVENTNEGIDTVQTALSGYTLAANVENLTLTGSTAIDGNGNALDNTLTGNAGKNTLSGGAGNDYYIIQTATDVVVENANAGTDTVQTTVTHTLGANIENLVLGGTTAINGTGNALNNTLTGNSAANVLTGSLGDDVYYASTGDTISEALNEGIDTVFANVNWTLATNVEHLFLTATAISGTGNTLNNSLTGNDGNNTLNGMAGADTMAGGLGDDIYVVDSSGDVIVENDNEGNDTVQSSVTYTLAANVENLTLTGATTINGTGNSLDNTLTGNTAINTLVGGLGNDVYIVGNAGAVIIENANQGVDSVQSSVTFTLAANVENLTLTGTGVINGTGNSLDNIIIGNSVANTLIGGAGHDTFDGGAGIDRIYGEDGNDTLYGGAATDTLVGGIGNDLYILDGVDLIIENTGEGTDTVQSSVTYTLAANVENLVLTGTTAINGTGNALDNTLTGNTAANALTGGAGDDTYYVGTGDSTVETANNGNDTVYANANWTLAANVENLFLIGTALTGTGNTAVNTLTGNASNNTLDGGTGADTLIGGTGDDLYIVDNAGDIIIENTNEGIDTIQTALSGYTLAANVENLTLTGSTAIDGNGNALDNTLTGNAGKNTLSGGAGNDYYIIQTATDVVVENANEGVDTVQTTVAYTLGANIENLVLGGTTAISGTGNALNNTLTGNSAANVLTGGLGDDVYYVSTGDTVSEAVNEGNDTVFASVSWTLANNVENLVLNVPAALAGTGNALDNILVGNESNNTLNGLGGVDTMIGGAGDDIYIVDNSADTIIENGDSGIDTVQSSAANYTLSANVENLTLTGTSAINGTGNDLNNTLTGNTAINTLVGGLGDDLYVVSNSGAVIVENANEGVDTVQSSVSFALAANIENLTLTGAAVINGTGNGLDNIINGNSGANTLMGGAGKDTFDGGGGIDRIYGEDGDDTLYGAAATDTLVGGIGNDLYILDGVDVIIENTAEGTDTVQSSVTYTLAANLEVLILTGTTAINGTGNASDNTITGNGAANALSGGAGDDIYYVSTGDSVVETANNGNDTVYADVNWTLSANVENLFLTGTALVGTGNTSANILTGNAENNTIDGGTGADTLIGGSGDDIYVVDNAGDVVIENASEGIDTIQSSVAIDSLGNNIENISLTGAVSVNAAGNSLNNIITGNNGNNILSGEDGNDAIDGGAGADTLYGGNGNDFLNGGAGADDMYGGVGDDIYVLNVSTDTIVENANEGTDTVIAGINYTLGSNLENLILSGTTGIDGTGNAANNTVTGNIGANLLRGSNGDDVIFGDAGNDTIHGDADNDTLWGGDGIDTLWGETGADIFGFTAATAYSGVDIIKDFSAAEGDKIDLKDVLDGIYNVNTDNLLDFVQLTQSAGNTLISIDVDGTGTAFGFTQIANIQGVIGLGDANNMLANGALLIA